MKKKNFENKIRRLVVSLVCIGMIFISFGTSAQMRVTLSLKKATMREFLSEIEQKSDFRFSYADKNISNAKNISLNVTDEKVEELLTRVLSANGLTYTVSGNTVAINPVDAIQQGEQKKITGIVKDEFGEPVAGANVSEKGTTNGTITDENGAFTLNVASEKSVIVISYIGYNNQELTVSGKSSIDINLSENTQALDEVVVVGYGVEKKVNVIGSISTVSADKIENRSTPSLTNALAGQMPGVTVRQTSGSPGNDAGEIRIRGVGSFGATPSALILIDGIPGSLSDIHIDDVENISVLKDASSAAIYGSRAANGVILITTKTGKVGTPRVNYNGYIGTSSATALPNKVDTWEYATLYNIANGSEVFSAAEIQKFKDGSDPYNYANNQYLDEIFHSSMQTGHDVSISGGNEGNKYMLSMGYLYQDGIVDKNNYTRYNVRLNLITSLWERLTLTSRLQGVVGNRKQPNTPYGKDSQGLNAIISNSLRWPGTTPTYTADGAFGPGEEGHGTSISWLKSKSFMSYDFHNVSINERLDYNVFDGLNLSIIGAYDYTSSESKNFRSTYKTSVITSTANYLNNQMDKTIYKTFQALADYNKTFGSHSVGALLGYSWEQSDNRYVSAARSNLPSDDYPEIDTGDADLAANTGGGVSWALQSLFGRLKYNFMERYLAEFTFRYDGSSRFPKDKRYAFFPSAAVGWRISEESFIKDNYSWINNLKLKASYGKLGNQNIGNYPYQSVYNNGYNYPFGSSLAQGVAITTSVDPTLHWESTKTTDFGIEGSLWKGLLNFDISYFYRKTTDILFSPSASVSSIFGYQLSQMNMGKLSNKGFEFQIGHNNSIGEFHYNVASNFSIIKNKVISLGLADVEQDNGLVGNGTYFVGYPMDIYYGYETDGVFLDQNDINAWADQSAIAKNPQIGDIRYVDIDGDGKVTAKDRKVLGSRIPEYTFGISLGCDYKGFDFSMQLQGVTGVKGYLSDHAGLAFFGYGSIQRWQADGRFDPSNPTRYPDYPRLELIQNSSNNTLTSSFWVRDAAYLRVKTIQLGYTLPKSITDILRIQKMRCYIQAENPITFHHFPEGWDPEINTGGSYYPILKTYTFGINLQF